MKVCFVVGWSVWDCALFDILIDLRVQGIKALGWGKALQRNELSAHLEELFICGLHDCYRGKDDHQRCLILGNHRVLFQPILFVSFVHDDTVNEERCVK